jgi:non-specific serine/threonine protein kinase
VPVFEHSGVLVRLPDWWKRRPRPRVSVTIGSKRQKKFDSTAMLDFQVQLALGDEPSHRGRYMILQASQLLSKCRSVSVWQNNRPR